MKRVGILLSILVMVFGLSVSAQAALQDMHDGTIYDTDTQLSWLQDANTAGLMSWDQANAWIATLNSGSGFAGFKDWRLPATSQPDATCSAHLDPGDGFPIQGYGFNCANNEMSNLYYALGNAADGPLTNTGPFTNLQDFYYWSGTEYAPYTGNAWDFMFGGGFQSHDNKGNVRFALAVRPGARTVSGGRGATPVGYNPQWLIITLVSLTIVGGVLLRKRIARQ